MDTKTLLDGLNFAKEYHLSPMEISALIPFFEKPRNTKELAEILNRNKVTVHHLIQRLRLKGVLVLKEVDSNGTYLFEFNNDTQERLGL